MCVDSRSDIASDKIPSNTRFIDTQLKKKILLKAERNTKNGKQICVWMWMYVNEYGYECNLRICLYVIRRAKERTWMWVSVRIYICVYMNVYLCIWMYMCICIVQCLREYACAHVTIYACVCLREREEKG